MTSDGYRVETDTEGFSRLWRDGRVVATIIATYNGWTATPTVGRDHRWYGWRCRTRREAVARVTEWLEEGKP